MPRTIEDHLRRSAFIHDAMVLAHDQKFVAAMITIDPVTVAAWALGRKLPFASHADLAAASEVRQLIREEVRARNAGLPQAARVRRFLLLERTPAVTMEASLSHELRRQATLAGNAALVQSLFQSQPGSAAPTEVPDEIVVAIEDVDEFTAAAWVPAHA